MRNRFAKVIVDIVKVYFIRWEGNTFISAAVGTACALFFAFHIYRNWGWLASSSDDFFSNKLKGRKRWLYIVDVLSMTAWGISGIAGFLLIVAHMGDIEGLLAFERVYAISTRTAAYLVIVHIIKHLAQFVSYLKLRVGDVE